MATRKKRFTIAEVLNELEGSSDSEIDEYVESDSSGLLASDSECSNDDRDEDSSDDSGEIAQNDY